MTNNIFTSVDSMSFFYLTNLNVLNFSSNLLTKFDFNNFFVNKLNFSLLDLSNNQISRIEGFLTKKITIILNDNQITCFDYDFFEIVKIFDVEIINNKECNNTFNFSKYRLYSIPEKNKNEAFTIYIKLLVYTFIATLLLVFLFWLLHKSIPKKEKNFEDGYF